MKRYTTLKSAALAALALLLIGTPIAMANIPAENAADTAESAIGRFQVISFELPEIVTDNSAELPYLSDGTLEKLLEEKTAFREETRPLIHTLKSKWTALTNELAKHSPEEARSARLQAEISALDTQLTEMRLDHLMAMAEIRIAAAD